MPGWEDEPNDSRWQQSVNLKTLSFGQSSSVNFGTTEREVPLQMNGKTTVILNWEEIQLETLGETLRFGREPSEKQICLQCLEDPLIQFRADRRGHYRSARLLKRMYTQEKALNYGWRAWAATDYSEIQVGSQVRVFGKFTTCTGKLEKPAASPSCRWTFSLSLPTIQPRSQGLFVILIDEITKCGNCPSW